MACTSSSETRPRLGRLIASAAVGAAAAGGAAALAGAALGPGLARCAGLGLGAAWAAACLSAALLWWAQGKPFPTFWRASAAGLAVRAAVLAGLMVWAWRWSLDEAAALLVAYAGAVVLLLVLEVVRSRS